MAVSPADVNTGFNTDLSDATVQAFIDEAEIEVSDRLAGAGVSSERTDLIAKYLARHLIRSISDDRELTSGSSESTEASFAGVYGEGLHSTQAGQRVIDLDPTDTFADASNRTASINIPEVR